MIESIFTVLKDRQEPLNTINMEIYTCMSGMSLNYCRVYVYFDMTGTEHLWKKSQTQMINYLSELRQDHVWSEAGPFLSWVDASWINHHNV